MKNVKKKTVAVPTVKASVGETVTSVVNEAAKAAAPVVKETAKIVTPIVKEAVKAVVPVSKEAPAKAEAKPAVKEAEAKKTAEKKAPAKKAASKPAAKKVEIKENITLEFSGKTYTKEDLIKSIKDIWKYDYKKKVSDLKSIDLYVKPEEGKAYYVINGQTLGNFLI